jgi:hypothetical protein
MAASSAPIMVGIAQIIDKPFALENNPLTSTRTGRLQPGQFVGVDHELNGSGFAGAASNELKLGQA